MRRGLWLALILIGVGYFGPWAAHRDAGLVLSADDLAEFAKLMPVVRSGEVAIVRELFFVPIWITAIGVGLLAGHCKAIWLKITLLGLSWLLVFTPLPKYPELLSAYRSPEFAPSFWLTVVAVLISGGLTFWGSRLPDRVEAIVWFVLGIAAASLAPLHFVKLQPAIDRLYHVGVGWGTIAVAIGGIGLAVVGGWAWLDSKRHGQSLRDFGRRFNSDRGA